MTVAIVDYGSGNLRSAAKAFERVMAESGREQPVVVTDRAEIVARADRVVLPGQGAFGDCLRGLTAVDGMVEALTEAVIRRAVPFFGICVGMQLMAQRGLEHGTHAGLGWIPGDVVAIPAAEGLRIPHMGWNQLHLTAPGHPVLEGTEEGTHVYFVHSYYFAAAEPEHVLATVDYGVTQPCIVGRDNMVGTQFHPEKSQAAGLRLIANFLAWTP